MHRRLLTSVLVSVLLAGGAAGVHSPLASVLSRAQQHEPSTGKVPNQVQMDRDFADVPRTQISSPAGTVSPRVETAPVTAGPLLAPGLTIEQPAAIIKQQHVFRI